MKQDKQENGLNESGSKKWLIVFGLVAASVFVALFVAGLISQIDSDIDIESIMPKQNVEPSKPPLILDVNATDGSINDQNGVKGWYTEYEGGAIKRNSVEVGDDGTIYCNKSNGCSYAFRLRLKFGSDGSGGAIHRPLVCIANDPTNPCEGDEMERISSWAWHGHVGHVLIPTKAVPNKVGYCIDIEGDYSTPRIDPGETAIYTFAFSMNNRNCDANDTFYIFQWSNPDLKYLSNDEGWHNISDCVDENFNVSNLTNCVKISFIEQQEGVR